ncbi:unnamed protein product, partial [Brenthis ino]
MIKKTLFISFMVIILVACNIEGKKLSRSRSSGSGRSTGRKTHYNPQPAPTSISHPQPSAPKPTLFGWQEKSAQNAKTPNNQGHSYPSSNTGLSGNSKPKQTATQQDSIQRSNVPLQQSAPAQNNNHQSHAYPASNSMSGNSNSGTGVGYPQGSGLSGSNAASPPHQGINSPNNYKPQTYPQGSNSGLPGSNVAPPPYQNNYPTNNHGNTYQNPHGAPPSYMNSGNNFYHPQGPPPPYFGHNSGGYGGHGYSPQTPGYFGNYMNSGRNSGGVSRTGSALTGVGIAGAGIGTVLTGLALWNLARSTGHNQHTVIYDKGQPIAVVPEGNTAPVVDPILGDLVNCTLTINKDNVTEVLAIPCSIATSFTPDATVKDVSMNDNAGDTTKCTITVVTKGGKEFMTTIPCSVLLNTAAQNNVTESPIIENSPILSNDTSVPTNDTSVPTNDTSVPTNDTSVPTNDKLLADQPADLKFPNIDVKNESTALNCTHEEAGEIRDPINPCFSLKHNLTVIPLQENENHNN